uniref:Aspartyl/asparaginy/proline hydroxylase domain-containing protein n=1 Tax=Acrobeloides nanus TaxID=290746 RepID=A0A914BWT2_9BILA
MRASVSEQEELFLNMDLGEASPIWDRARLSTDIREDLAELEDNYDMILDNCQKALNCAYLWKRNEELTSTWFVFPLINQGVWQEAQCRVCSDLVKLLHKLDSLLVDCVFGNVFISMLPANASISEHRGMTNVRLRCHYGVEVPKDTENCFMMVGDEKFNWEDGRCVVIDDSFKYRITSGVTTQ